MRTRAAKSAAEAGGTLTPSTASGSGIRKAARPGTKAAKREQKHSALLSRVSKNFSTAKPLKRRRPSKKLVASLSSLVDALPEDAGQDNPEDADADAVTIGANGAVRVRNKSLKSRPGAQKRRAKLEEMERSWFDQNVATLVKSAPAQPTAQGSDRANTASTDTRWASLKQHVLSNLQKAKPGEPGGGPSA